MLIVPPSMPAQHPPTPRAAVMVNRVIWAALILGQLAFGAVVAVVVSKPAGPNQNPPQPILFYINIVMAAVMIPAGFFIKQTIWNKSRRETGAVTVGAYGTGSIIFWACCEAPSFFALITCIIIHSLSPGIFVSAVCIAIQIVTFPTAAPLQSSSSISP